MEVIMKIRVNKNLLKAMVLSLLFGFTGNIFADDLAKRFDKLLSKDENDSALDVSEDTKAILSKLEAVAKIGMDKVTNEEGNNLSEDMQKAVIDVLALGEDAKKIILPVAKLKIAYAVIINSLNKDEFKDALVNLLKADTDQLKIDPFLELVVEFYTGLDGNDGRLNLTLDNSVKNHIQAILTQIITRLNCLIENVKKNIIDPIKAVDNSSVKVLVLRGKVFSINGKMVDLSGLIENIKNIFKESLMADLKTVIANAIKAIKNMPEQRKTELLSQHTALADTVNEKVSGALFDGVMGAVKLDDEIEIDEFTF